MISGYVTKSKSNGSVEDNEMDLINTYSTKKLTKDDVYVFNVTLCDNDIDRDFDRFTNDSLKKLSKLFIGKPGIFDHEMKSKNQVARTISCSVKTDKTRTNKIGEPYSRLIARAYISRTDKNKHLINDIESGIKKEVSISCSVSKGLCSICGSDVKSNGCGHVKGSTYNLNGMDVCCHTILDNPIDAYEWSFVAVPAQKNAGVTKRFLNNLKGGELSMDDIIKKIRLGKGISLNDFESQELSSFIDELEDLANCGKAYKKELKREVSKLYALNYADIDGETVNNVVSKMNIRELEVFKKSLAAKSLDKSKIKPQLYSNKQNKVKDKNNQFKI